MKQLVQFIKESYEDKQIQNLRVFYVINNNERVVVQAPETYSEDDITIYLGDKWFNSFPGKSEQSKVVLGKNIEKLIDMYFEYESFEHIKDYTGHIDVEWDNSYDTKNVDTQSVDTFAVSNMKLVLQFESFGIKVESEEAINDDLSKIFKTTESNALNIYPIKLYLDKDKPFEYDNN